jgi:hypothetical protein
VAFFNECQSIVYARATDWYMLEAEKSPSLSAFEHGFSDLSMTDWLGIVLPAVGRKPYVCLGKVVLPIPHCAHILSYKSMT